MRWLVAWLGLLLLAPSALPAHSPAAAVHIDADLLGSTGTASVIVQTHGPPDPATLERFARIGEVHTTYDLIHAVHLELDAGRIRELARDAAVWRIDEDEPLELHLDDSRPAVGVSQQLWDQGFDGSGVSVAIIDTGIDAQHPGMQGRVAQGVVFTGSSSSGEETPASTDTDGHGTHVGGIVAGSGARSTLLGSDDGRYGGLAASAQLISLDISQSFTTSTAIKAFEWVRENRDAYNIQVVQNSWGRQETGERYDPRDPAVRASNALVHDEDLVVIFSAGNAGPDPSTLSMEAQNPAVLSVAAVDDVGRPASFSSRGPVLMEDGSEASWLKPDIAAPGVSISSAAAGARTGTSTYTQLSGTSQAAPHAAGVAAILREAAPELSAVEVHEVLRRSARDLGPPGPDAVTGHGYLDAIAAIETALQAANGTLTVPTVERYESKGTITAGELASGVLPSDTGVDVGLANGTFPVKAGATELQFTFAWNATDPRLPRPIISVHLVDPGGQAMEVPASEGQATRTIQDPVNGTWSWEAVTEEAVDTGASYHALTKVTTPEPIDLAGGPGAQPNPDEGWRARLSDAFGGFAEAVGVTPIQLIAGVAGVLVLALIVRAARD